MDASVPGWILNLAYLALLALLSPMLLYRAAVHGKYRTGWREKFLGQAPFRKSQATCVWLHAVSVGEVLLLRTIISGIKGLRPDADIWISTTTHTGHAVAREKYPGCRVFYYPLDFTWSVREALRRVRPDVIGMAELELWPNLIREAAAQGISLVLMNARLSDRSFRGYSRIRFVVGPVLRCFARIGAQNEEYRDRFVELGARSGSVVTTGSVKFDGVAATRDRNRIARLRHELKVEPQQKVLVAGSTHAPEEALVLSAYRTLLRSYPNLRLIIAPRHQERFSEVAALIEGQGFAVTRRTGPGAGLGRRKQAAVPVILLDTLGELSTVWSLADMAFVGGSLSRRGGQNMLEPCAYGTPVMCGPNTWHFKQIVEWLRSQEGLAIVRDEQELATQALGWLDDPGEAWRMGENARQAVRSQQGATERTLELLADVLGEADAAPMRRAA